MSASPETRLGAYEIARMLLPRTRTGLILAPVLLAALWWISTFNFLLAHSLAEVFSVVVAGAIFTLAWNTRRQLGDAFLPFLGIAYLYVALLDVVHTLAYEGLGTFNSPGPNLATELWLAARYLQAVSLLVAPWFLRRQVRLEFVWALYTTITGLLLWVVFAEVLPDAHVPGMGLTPFKIISEYAISGILAVALWRLIRVRHALNPTLFTLVAASIVATILSELLFATYVSVYSSANLLGHILKIIAFYFLYRAIVEAGLQQPLAVLFRELEQAEERSSTIVEVSPDTIVIVDQNGSIAQANYQAEVLFGYPRTELVGQPIERLVPERHRAAHEQHRVGYAAQPASRPMGAGLELWARRRDGTEFPVEISLSPLVLGGEHLVISSIRDVSTRRAVEAERARLAAMVESARDAIVGIRPDGEIAYWNRGAEELFGWTAAEAVGLRAGIMLPPGHSVSAAPGMRALQGERIADYETERLCKDGTLVPVSVTVSPVLDAEGQVIELCAVYRDITERKRTAEQLERAGAELERRNADLQQLAFVASHDLQEPLRMVASYVQLLARRYKGKLDADADEFIDFAVDGAQRMQQQIQGLLQYARVGSQGREPEPTDCEQVLAKVLEGLDLALRDQDGVVTHDPLPTVLGEPLQLGQLFQNLITNALKFHGVVPPRVHIAAAPEGESWCFSVRDNGIGIAVEHHEQVFGLFQRLHSPTEYAGTGIGLATCRRIVERHGGRIWVDSAPGAGSTFYFTLPAVSSAALPSAVLR